MKDSLLGQKISPQMAMELSIEEAKKGLGFVSPNPPVGCVIVDKNHHLLSLAHHSAYGKEHAEIAALKKIKNKKDLEGASLYVSLEPCAHQGKTSPCVDALIQEPFSTIYYGQKDPNPKTNGKGIQRLKDQGFEVKPYIGFKDALENLYQSFNYNMIFNSSFVSLKVATSLDGMLALSDGSSEWISSEESRDRVSHLRAYHDAVLIGVGTFLADNPRLNSRKSPFQNKENKVIILDPHGKSLDLIEKSHLAKVRPLSNILVITKDISAKKSFQILKGPWDSSKNQFNLKQIKKILYKEYAISSVLVEGGAFVFSSFLDQDEADFLYHFLSPSILGGKRGISWAQFLKTKDLGSKKRLKIVASYPLGEDIFLEMALLKSSK